MDQQKKAGAEFVVWCVQCIYAMKRAVRDYSTFITQCAEDHPKNIGLGFDGSDLNLPEYAGSEYVYGYKKALLRALKQLEGLVELLKKIESEIPEEAVGVFNAHLQKELEEHEKKIEKDEYDTFLNDSWRYTEIMQQEDKEYNRMYGTDGLGAGLESHDRRHPFYRGYFDE